MAGRESSNDGVRRARSGDCGCGGDVEMEVHRAGEGGCGDSGRHTQCCAGGAGWCLALVSQSIWFINKTPLIYTQYWQLLKAVVPSGTKDDPCGPSLPGSSPCQLKPICTPLAPSAKRPFS